MVVDAAQIKSFRDTPSDVAPRALKTFRDCILRKALKECLRWSQRQPQGNGPGSPMSCFANIGDMPCKEWRYALARCLPKLEM